VNGSTASAGGDDEGGAGAAWSRVAIITSVPRTSSNVSALQPQMAAVARGVDVAARCVSGADAAGAAEIASANRSTGAMNRYP
jgi:hypothetical protein